MEGMNRKYDPRQVLIDALRADSEELKQKSNDLFLVLQDVLNEELKQEKGKISETIKDIESLIQYIEKSKDKALAVRVEQVLKKRY